MQRTRVDYFHDDFLLQTLSGLLNDQLDQVWRILVHVQPGVVASHVVVDGLYKLIIKIFENVLHYIIAVIVLRIPEHIEKEAVRDSLLLRGIVDAVLDELLDHAQTMLVCRNLVELTHDTFKQLSFDALGKVLYNQHDHVVAFDMFWKLQKVIVVEKSFPDKFKFLWLLGSHEHFLKYVSAFLIAADLDKLLVRDLPQEVDSLSGREAAN